MRVIVTNRLTLEPQVASHAEEMFGVLSDPAIYEFENEPPSSVEWLRERFAKLETRRSPDGRERWLNWVVRDSPARIIGYVQATVHVDGHAGIAYELASAHWGRGYGGEAVEAMIAELALRYQVREISAVLKRANFRSKRLLDRLGFSIASSGRHAIESIPADEVLMLRPAVRDPIR